jgi:hypothetical protein
MGGAGGVSLVGSGLVGSGGDAETAAAVQAANARQSAAAKINLRSFAFCFFIIAVHPFKNEYKLIFSLYYYTRFTSQKFRFL